MSNGNCATPQNFRVKFANIEAPALQLLGARTQRTEFEPAHHARQCVSRVGRI